MELLKHLLATALEVGGSNLVGRHQMLQRTSFMPTILKKKLSRFSGPKSYYRGLFNNYQYYFGGFRIMITV